MELLTSPDLHAQELFPPPPEGETFAALHRQLELLRPVLSGWKFNEGDGQGQGPGSQRPGVTFTFGDGFTGLVALEEDEVVVEVYAGKCPMDAAALRMMLRHKASWPWMTRGRMVEGGVMIYLNSRHLRTDVLGGLTAHLLAGMEVAFWQRAQLNIWWSRLEWAVREPLA